MHGKLLKGLSAMVIVLALAFPFLLALEKISESDTFWHLKTGEWIIAHGAVPRVDPFSATVIGKQWLDWEWLLKVAIYVVYTWGGFNALVVGKAIVVFLTGLVLFLACRRNGAGVSLAGKLLAIHPRYFYARLLQAQIKTMDGDLDDAVAETESVLAEQPHSAQVWLLRAQLAGRQGDRPAAIRALPRTVAEQVEDAHLYLFLGQLLAADGRTNEAVTAYEKCLQLWNGPTNQREQIEADLAKLHTSAAK
jgi:tetratricopeptide (TPR) repeat protein